MTTKVFSNIATDRTRTLIQLLSELEIVDRQRMSSDGKLYLDRIWKLLGQPTYDEVQKMNVGLENKSNYKSFEGEE